MRTPSARRRERSWRPSVPLPSLPWRAPCAEALCPRAPPSAASCAICSPREPSAPAVRACSSSCSVPRPGSTALPLPCSSPRSRTRVRWAPFDCSARASWTRGCRCSLAPSPTSSSGPCSRPWEARASCFRPLRPCPSLAGSPSTGARSSGRDPPATWRLACGPRRTRPIARAAGPSWPSRTCSRAWGQRARSRPSRSPSSRCGSWSRSRPSPRLPCSRSCGVSPRRPGLRCVPPASWWPSASIPPSRPSASRSSWDRRRPRSCACS